MTWAERGTKYQYDAMILDLLLYLVNIGGNGVSKRNEILLLLRAGKAVIKWDLLLLGADLRHQGLDQRDTSCRMLTQRPPI